MRFEMPPSQPQTPAGPGGETPAAGTTTRSRSGSLLILAVVAVVLVAGVSLASQSFFQPPASKGVITTTFEVTPAALLSSAVQQNQAGYTLESSKQGVVDGGRQGGDWAYLGNPAGSAANLTVFAFSTSNASTAFYTSSVSAVRGLPGYSDVSSDLGSFQRYGSCYAYGEDVDGIAVVDGICAAGNLVLRVHLVSSVAFQQLESDMQSLMGSMYDSLA